METKIEEIKSAMVVLKRQLLGERALDYAETSEDIRKNYEMGMISFLERVEQMRDLSLTYIKIIEEEDLTETL